MWLLQVVVSVKVSQPNFVRIFFLPACVFYSLAIYVHFLLQCFLNYYAREEGTALTPLTRLALMPSKLLLSAPCTSSAQAAFITSIKQSLLSENSPEGNIKA
jgi:hypothetical protein